MDIFISYAYEDLTLFRIPEIAEYLEHKLEIGRVFYWERDNSSTQTIVAYMEQTIINCDIVLAISSEFSSKSSPVEKELEFAIIKNKIIIPIFKDIAHVKEFITIFRGLEFGVDFQEFLDNLISIIKGNRTSKVRDHEHQKVQKLFENLWKMTSKLFNPNLETSHSFTRKLLRSEEMQDYFGITVRKKENLENQNVGFLDGKYYIIPNSKTLRVRRDSGEASTLLTKNNLLEIYKKDKNTILIIFFFDIKKYVEKEFNLKLSLELVGN